MFKISFHRKEQIDLQVKPWLCVHVTTDNGNTSTRMFCIWKGGLQIGRKVWSKNLVINDLQSVRDYLEKQLEDYDRILDTAPKALVDFTGELRSLRFIDEAKKEVEKNVVYLLVPYDQLEDRDERISP